MSERTGTGPFGGSTERSDAGGTADADDASPAAGSWQVTLQLRPVGVEPGELLRMLGQPHAVIAAGSTRQGVTVSLAVAEAADPVAAIRQATDTLESGAAGTLPMVIDAASALGPRRLEDPELLADADLLDYTGVAELLDVGPVAFWDFALSPRFPRPVAHLARGPVWSRADILRFLWDTEDGSGAAASF